MLFERRNAIAELGTFLWPFVSSRSTSLLMVVVRTVFEMQEVDDDPENAQAQRQNETRKHRCLLLIMIRSRHIALNQLEFKLISSQRIGGTRDMGLPSQTVSIQDHGE